MKIKLFVSPSAAFLCLAALTVMLASGCGQPANTANNQAAVAAAQNWLSLIDQGNYSESWKEADPLFQRAVTGQQWQDAMEKFRQPLGALISRNVKSTQAATQLPSAPDGQYVVMQFKTSFANKKDAIETVTVGPKKDGQWLASGYYIK